MTVERHVGVYALPRSCQEDPAERVLLRRVVAEHTEVDQVIRPIGVVDGTDESIPECLEGDHPTTPLEGIRLKGQQVCVEGDDPVRIGIRPVLPILRDLVSRDDTDPIRTSGDPSTDIATWKPSSTMEKTFFPPILSLSWKILMGLNRLI